MWRLSGVMRRLAVFCCSVASMAALSAQPQMDLQTFPIKGSRISARLPTGWESEKYLLGNRLVARQYLGGYEPGTSPMIFVTDSGLNSAPVGRLSTALRRKAGQVCFHATTCERNQPEVVQTGLGRSMLQTLDAVEMGKRSTYWNLVAKDPEGRVWSATLVVFGDLSAAQKESYRSVVLSLFEWNKGNFDHEKQ